MSSESNDTTPGIRDEGTLASRLRSALGSVLGIGRRARETLSRIVNPDYDAVDDLVRETKGILGTESGIKVLDTDEMPAVEDARAEGIEENVIEVVSPAGPEEQVREEKFDVLGPGGGSFTDDFAFPVIERAEVAATSTSGAAVVSNIGGEHSRLGLEDDEGAEEAPKVRETTCIVLDDEVADTMIIAAPELSADSLEMEDVVSEERQLASVEAVPDVVAEEPVHMDADAEVSVSEDMTFIAVPETVAQIGPADVVEAVEAPAETPVLDAGTVEYVAPAEEAPMIAPAEEQAAVPMPEAVKAVAAPETEVLAAPAEAIPLGAPESVAAIESPSEAVEAIVASAGSEAVEAPAEIPVIVAPETVEAVEAQAEVEAIAEPVAVEAIEAPVETEAITSPETVEALEASVEVGAVAAPEAVEAIPLPETVEAVEAPAEIQMVTSPEVVESIEAPVEAEAIAAPEAVEAIPLPEVAEAPVEAEVVSEIQESVAAPVAVDVPEAETQMQTSVDDDALMDEGIQMPVDTPQSSFGRVGVSFGFFGLPSSPMSRSSTVRFSFGRL